MKLVISFDSSDFQALRGICQILALATIPVVQAPQFFMRGPIGIKLVLPYRRSA
jgi:hypothetical protein